MDMNQGIQNIIDKDRQTYHIPGIEVSIICPGDNAPRDFVSGTTEINGNTLVQTDSMFQIGSETKSFIAVILLQLEAEGLLSIDDPIGKWLPAISPDWRDITIRQLLNHTSGIYNFTDVMIAMIIKDNNFDLKKQWTSDELLKLLDDQSPYFEPGMGWHYSNSNYILAGMVIESVTGKSIGEEMKIHLIDPLGLSNTHYIPAIYTDKIMQHMAHGYARSGIFHEEPKDITESNSSWAGAAGANISTSHDMAIWFNKLTSGNILPAQQMKEMTSLVNENNGQSIPDTAQAAGYGLAIMHDFTTFGEESWWHSGGTLGYSSFMVRLKGNDVIITVNANEISAIEPKERDLYFLTKDLIAYVQQSDPS